jgi:hypothetical protein
MQAKSHTVHVDVVMDVMRILFNNEIPFSVEGINENEKTLLIRTSTNAKLTRHKKALENIKTLTSDYSYYRHSSDSGKNLGIDLNDEEE